MIDGNSRDAVIRNMTADAVSLREAAVFVSFPESHNQQRSRRALPAREITAAVRNYSHWAAQAAG